MVANEYDKARKYLMFRTKCFSERKGNLGGILLSPRISTDRRQDRCVEEVHFFAADSLRVPIFN